jgi:dTDP-4-dehydrorhamnose 3,5-epimerase
LILGDRFNASIPGRSLLFECVPLAIRDVLLIKPRRFGDDRGWFTETYSAPKFAELGLSAPFVQDNQSFSARKGTIRGLHAQAPPFAQAKLVRVLRGAILDVAVDIRTTSDSYGKWVSAELSADSGACLYIPHGFLHGFVTLQDDTEVFYKVDNIYSKECELSAAWNDPEIGIDWQVEASNVSLSEKDAQAPSLRLLKSPF